VKKVLIFVLIYFLICPTPVIFAAITATTAWEVRSGSAATNGGGFDIATAGTNMAIFDNKNAAGCSSCQSASVNISTTDAVTNGTTTITSATANFSSAIVGNVIYVTGGTGSITAAWYQVATFTNSTTIVVDRSTGLTTGTGATMNIGGALDLPTTANSVPVVAGNTIWVKGASYTVANATYANGTVSAPIWWVGFTSTHGDGGKATLVASGSSGQMITSGNYNRWNNWTWDANGATTAAEGCFTAAQGTTADNIECKNYEAATGISGAALGTFTNLYSHDGRSGCTQAVSNPARLSKFVIDTQPCIGIAFTSGSCTNACNLTVENGIIRNGTGATGHGISSTVTSGGVIIERVTIDTMAGDAILCSGADVCVNTVGRNLILSNITGTALNSSTTDYTAAQYTAFGFDYIGFYNNGTNRTRIPAGAHDVTISAQPYIAAGTNYGLNSIGGAQVRGLGWPGTFQGLTSTVDYGDLGAAQAQSVASTRGYAQ